jgi:hypothetical protein
VYERKRKEDQERRRMREERAAEEKKARLLQYELEKKKQEEERQKAIAARQRANRNKDQICQKCCVDFQKSDDIVLVNIPFPKPAKVEKLHRECFKCTTRSNRTEMYWRSYKG